MRTLSHLHALGDDLELVLVGRAPEVREEDDLLVAALGPLRLLLQEVERDDDRVQPVALKVAPLDVLLDELQQLQCTENTIFRFVGTGITTENVETKYMYMYYK